ncbi:MAG TPA: hypothetical protein VIP09_06425 [Dehalococcoidia bacterium]|jgi:hypothetical protein
MRALAVTALVGVTGLVASGTHSTGDAILAALLYVALLGINAWTGYDGSYVELQPDRLNVSKVASTGRTSMTVGSKISYSDVDSVRVKKSGDFELRYLDKGRREKVKKVSFKILPQLRKEFLDDLLSRLQEARPEGVTVTDDRKLQ